MASESIKKFLEAVKNSNLFEAKKYLEQALKEKTAKRIKKVLDQ